MLDIVRVPLKRYPTRNRAKEPGKLLTSETHVNTRKMSDRAKAAKEFKQHKSSKKKCDSDQDSAVDINNCRGSGESCFKTKKKKTGSNVIHVVIGHENCTEFDTMCQTCGLEDSKQKPKEVKSGRKRKWMKTTKNL